MKLTRLKATNFRSLKSVDLKFPASGLLVLVGANNAGKSNLIRAINNILGADWWSEDRLELHDFYGRKKQNRINISLSFDTGERAGFNWNTIRNEYKAFMAEGGSPERFLSNEFKQRCPCTYLGADRTFDRQMAFYDWTLIGKIRKAFNLKCTPLREVLNDKFDQVVSIFNQVEGFSEFKADFGRFFEEMQADIPIKMSVDFKPFTPTNYFKTMQILASDPSQGGSDLDLEELGEGTRNLALLALLRSYAINLRQAGEDIHGILALEEPEIYLHPQSQRNLFRVLREIAASGIQVIVSTHSSSFVDTELFDSIALVRKVSDPEAPGQQCTDVTLVSKTFLVQHCIATGVPATKTNITNITEHYRTTSNHRLNEAFFARFVILVEGETEELALPEYLRSVGLDCDMRGVSVVAVGGKNQLPKYWRLFSAFKIPLLVVFDNDDDGDGEKRKSNKNVSCCFDITMAQILHANAWSEITSNLKPQTPLIILGNNFEAALNADYALAPPLAEIVTEAKSVIKPVNDNQGKGLIGRYVARRIVSLHQGYAPAFVRRIAYHVNQTLGFRHAEPASCSGDVHREVSERV